MIICFRLGDGELLEKSCFFDGLGRPNEAADCRAALARFCLTALGDGLPRRVCISG